MALEFQIRDCTAREDGPRITSGADGGLDERGKVPAARELVLYAETAGRAEVMGPLSAEFAEEVESAAVVGCVGCSGEEGKDDPEEEGVDGEKGAVVEEDACPAEKRGEDTQDGGDAGEDEFRAVAGADDVCVGPDVEPGDEAEYEGEDGVGRQLRGDLVTREIRADRDHTSVLAIKRVHLNPFHRMSWVSSPSARSTRSVPAGGLLPCLRLRKPEVRGKANLEGR